MTQKDTLKREGNPLSFCFVLPNAISRLVDLVKLISYNDINNGNYRIHPTPRHPIDRCQFKNELTKGRRGAGSGAEEGSDEGEARNRAGSRDLERRRHEELPSGVLRAAASRPIERGNRND